jgi:hypothetical protein
MLGRGVPLLLPGTHHPPPAALDRTTPLEPLAARVVEAKQRARLGLTELQAQDADQHREQALDLAERPGEGAAEGTVRPHSALPILEHLFENTQPATLAI